MKAMFLLERVNDNLIEDFKNNIERLKKMRSHSQINDSPRNCIKSKKPSGKKRVVFFDMPPGRLL